jgi:hypothetical protein
MHGGLSPDLNSMEQIRRVMRPTDVSFSPSPVSHLPLWWMWFYWQRKEKWQCGAGCVRLKAKIAD